MVPLHGSVWNGHAFPVSIIGKLVKGPTHKDSLEYKIWFCTGPNIRLSSYSTPLLKLTHVRFCLLSFIMSD